jgi:hypothetical protein
MQNTKRDMKLNTLFFILVLTGVFACDDGKEDENPLLNRVIGTYEGVINYHDAPMPGDDTIERLTFNIEKKGQRDIKITTTFELILPVTGTFTNNDHEIISFGADRIITYNLNGIEITSGGSDFNGWGEMCGYYNATEKIVMITFNWTKGAEGGGAMIYGVRKE